MSPFLLITILSVITALILLMKRVRQLEKARQLLEKEKTSLQSSMQSSLQRLQKANRELEQFACRAAHDLQAPLRHLTSFSEFLQDELQKNPSSLEAEEYLNRIVERSKKMKILTGDLLSLSRLSAQNLSPREVSLSEVVAEVKEQLAGEISAREATVEIVGPVDKICADRQMICQLVHQLIANALKYQTPGRAPEVHLRGGEQSEGWKIEVSDNGVGIPAEFREKVFEAFQRLHGPRETSDTGIGLAICKTVVDLHGGHIWIEESPAKGCQFNVTLPKSSGVPTDTPVES